MREQKRGGKTRDRHFGNVENLSLSLSSSKGREFESKDEPSQFLKLRPRALPHDKIKKFTHNASIER